LRLTSNGLWISAATGACGTAKGCRFEDSVQGQMPVHAKARRKLLPVRRNNASFNGGISGWRCKERKEKERKKISI